MRSPRAQVTPSNALPRSRAPLPDGWPDGVPLEEVSPLRKPGRRAVVDPTGNDLELVTLPSLAPGDRGTCRIMPGEMPVLDTNAAQYEGVTPEVLVVRAGRRRVRCMVITGVALFSVACCGGSGIGAFVTYCLYVKPLQLQPPVVVPPPPPPPPLHHTPLPTPTARLTDNCAAFGPRLVCELFSGLQLARERCADVRSIHPECRVRGDAQALQDSVHLRGEPVADRLLPVELPPYGAADAQREHLGVDVEGYAVLGTQQEEHLAVGVDANSFSVPAVVSMPEMQELAEVVSFAASVWGACVCGD